ncbi:hypothetical protein [Cellulosimicrobium sp. Marseille-Q8652]
MRTSTERATVRRTGEVVLAALGLALSVLFLGGFAGVVNGVDEQAFLRDVHPALTSAGIAVAEADAYDAARTLAAWFGLTLVAVLATAVPGILVARSRPRRRAAAGLLLLAAGLVCLVGSQLILYPVAFCFFAAAALFVVRQVPPEEPREKGEAGGGNRRTGAHRTRSIQTSSVQTSSGAAQSRGARR